MASQAIDRQPSGVAELLSSMVSTDGSAGHRYLASAALEGDPAVRNLADVAHFICLLHGRYPGVIDHASARVVHPSTRSFIYRAAPGFAAERSYLTRLVVAAGPLPSTLGQAQSEAAVSNQSHALATLAQSERNGTAIGAAVALVMDWRPIRRVLDAAAQRFGIQVPPLDLPGLTETLAVAAEAAETPGIERAMAFGAQQLLVQHRGLWDLLESRESARRNG
ncbi:hypothetical protein DMC47_43845 [Nostoc sp. 3335mG]|nr:hypothetical protein DMC47_43845 [Nostoc sp. 3335mG]